MSIDWFLNERSLHAQFASHEQVELAVVCFLKLWRSIPTDSRLRSELFVCSTALEGEDLRATFRRLPRELQGAALKLLFDERSPRAWQPERVSTPEELWIFKSSDVSDTSMAEAAARRRTDQQVALLNFQGSFLAGVSEAILQRQDVMDAIVAVPSFDTSEALLVWFRTLSRVPEYSTDAREPPRDAQTCLGDPLRFEPLNGLVQNRRVYRERLTGRFLYVDNLHWGEAAELEVFDKRGVKHLGTADIRTGHLRPGTRDPQKDGKLSI